MKHIPNLSLTALSLAAVLAFTACEDKPSTPSTSAPVITAQPRDTSVADGANATFRVTATNATTYKWVRNITDTISGQTTATLIVTNITQANNNDTYKVVVGNANGTVVSNAATLTVTPPPGALTRAQMLVIGDSLVMQNCTGCHGTDLRGHSGGVPPLAYADYFMADRRNIIQTLLRGRDDSIFVNGLPYQSSMPGWDWMSDDDIASMLTYIRVVHNDSLVVSCNANNLDPDGFATCTKVARSASAIATDSVSVAEVKAIRDSLAALPSVKKGVRHY